MLADISTETVSSEVAVAYLNYPPPRFAVTFIRALCSDILASVPGFALALPRHQPKDSLIKHPQYKSDLSYFRVKFFLSLSKTKYLWST